ncbi:MAG: hypothetical protein MUO52_07945, partial [Desulfobacterales bacterium]|nr:hypothetical protein [Desulfobacterales bacterium]
TVGVFSSVREVLRRSKAQSVAVITPYIEDINASIRAGLEEDGFKVTAIHGMGIDVNFELATVTPEEIAAFSSERLKGVKADIIFFSCTNFHAMEALPLLKQHFECPMITSNTATLEAIVALEKKMHKAKPSD